MPSSGRGVGSPGRTRGILSRPAPTFSTAPRSLVRAKALVSRLTVQPRPLRLRHWQKAALDRYGRLGAADFLAVATPGAGKTTFALAAALMDLQFEPQRRVLVVTPTTHLKLQWTRAAAQLGLHLEPSWSARDGSARATLPEDMHGAVVTYQQVAASADSLRMLSTDAFVILDEVHHAGEERAWGDGLLWAFSGAARRLALSGTPFRSDTQAIPFIRYADDEAWPDFTYGYGEALEDGAVVRPVYFPRTDGRMEWTAPDGTRHSSTFTDPIARQHANQRLRTALSLEGEWLPTVVDRAHHQLLAIRRHHPSAGALAIAMDTEHADGVARLLRRRHGVDAVVVTSEDPQASARIARFAAGEEPWIVAVRMVSEGVDIPRLRVGVYATNTTTELFFRQAVGRLVRWSRGLRRQKAYLFIPDDERLRAHAAAIAEARRHTLRRSGQDEDPEELLDASEPANQPDEQLSLFAAISAVAIGDGHLDEDTGEAPDPDLWDEGDPDLTFALTAPPRSAPLTGSDAPTRQEHKRALRDWNADRARTLAQLTGASHARVNAELNRRAGIQTIGEATVHQLEARLEHARSWLRHL
jgi:superfamily II DNA or RNA helicase